MSSTAQGHPRPKPTPELIAEVREYASELHYALLNRPARKTDARERWDRQFRRVTYEVTQALNRARFPSLPRVAMGAIWVNNVNIVTHTDKGEQVPPFDTDTVIPIYPGHQCFDPPEHLRKAAIRHLEADDDSLEYGLLPLDQVRTRWWENYMDVSARPQPAGPSLHLPSPTPVPAPPPSAPSGVGPSGNRADESGDGAPGRGRPRTRAATSGPAPRAPSVSQTTGGEDETGGDDAEAAVSDGEEEVDELEEDEVSPATRKSSRTKRPTSRARTTAKPKKAKASAQAEGTGTRQKGKRKAEEDVGDAADAPEAKTRQKGKRKAEEDVGDAADAPEPKRKRGGYEMKEHKVPWMWRLHLRPCESCDRGGHTCHYCGLVATACRRCIAKKTGCSLAVTGGNTAAAYLGYEYYYRCCQELGNKRIPRPKSVPRDFEVPEWFLKQYQAISATERKAGPPSGNVGAVPFVPLPEISPPLDPLVVGPESALADPTEEPAPGSIAVSQTEAQQTAPDQPKKTAKAPPKNTSKDKPKNTVTRSKRGPPGFRTLEDAVPVASGSTSNPVTPRPAPSTSVPSAPAGRAYPSGPGPSSSPARRTLPQVPEVVVPPRRPSGGGASGSTSTTVVAATVPPRPRTRSRSRAQSDAPAQSPSPSAGPSASHISSRPSSPPASTPAGSSANAALPDDDDMQEENEQEEEEEWIPEDDDAQDVKMKMWEQGLLGRAATDEVEPTPTLYQSFDDVEMEHEEAGPSHSGSGVAKGKGRAIPAPIPRRRPSMWYEPRMDPRLRGQEMNSEEHVQAIQDDDGYDVVPQLKEKWTRLPWLTARLDGSPPSTSQGLPDTLEDLIKLRKLRPPPGPSSDPDISTPPATPPHQIFRLSSHTEDYLREAHEQTIDTKSIANHAFVLEGKLDALEDGIRIRRRNAALAAPDAVSFQDAWEKLYTQVCSSERDLADIAHFVATAYNQIGNSVLKFLYVPSNPVDYIALNEMLEVYHRQESLYHEMWARYNVLKERVDPLSADLAQIKEQVANFGEIATGQLSSNAVLDEHFNRLELQLGNVRAGCKLDLMEQLTDVWKEMKKIAEPHANTVLESLTALKANWQELSEAQRALHDLLGATRLDDQLHTGLAELRRRIGQVEQHVGIVEPEPSGSGALPADLGSNPPPPRSPSPREDPARRASSEPPDSTQGWRSSEFPAPTASPALYPDYFQPLFVPPPPDVGVEIQGLHARIDRLEASMEARVQRSVEERLPGAVEQYLSGVGLGPDMLKLLGEHVTSVIARRTEENGTQTPEE